MPPIYPCQQLCWPRGSSAPSDVTLTPDSVLTKAPPTPKICPLQADLKEMHYVNSPGAKKLGSPVSAPRKKFLGDLLLWVAALGLIVATPHPLPEERPVLDLLHDALHTPPTFWLSSYPPPLPLPHLALTALLYPILLLLRAVSSNPAHNHFRSYLFLRVVLASLYVYAFGRLRRATGRNFGRIARLVLTTLHLAPLPLLYAASRAFPATLGAAVGYLALAALLERRASTAAHYIGYGGVLTATPTLLWLWPGIWAWITLSIYSALPKTRTWLPTYAISPGVRLLGVTLTGIFWAIVVTALGPHVVTLGTHLFHGRWWSLPATMTGIIGTNTLTTVSRTLLADVETWTRSLALRPHLEYVRLVSTRALPHAATWTAMWMALPALYLDARARSLGVILGMYVALMAIGDPTAPAPTAAAAPIALSLAPAVVLVHMLAGITVAHLWNLYARGSTEKIPTRTLPSSPISSPRPKTLEAAVMKDANRRASVKSEVEVDAEVEVDVRDVEDKHHHVNRSDSDPRDDAGLVVWLGRTGVRVLVAGMALAWLLDIGPSWLRQVTTVRHTAPGGIAMAYVRGFACPNERRNCSIYVDEWAARTGYSRFAHRDDPSWDVIVDASLSDYLISEQIRFDFVLRDAGKPPLAGYESVGEVKTFRGWKPASSCLQVATQALDVLRCSAEEGWGALFPTPEYIPSVEIYAHRESGLQTEFGESAAEMGRVVEKAKREIAEAAKGLADATQDMSQQLSESMELLARNAAAKRAALLEGGGEQEHGIGRPGDRYR